MSIFVELQYLWLHKTYCFRLGLLISERAASDAGWRFQCVIGQSQWEGRFYAHFGHELL